MSYASLIFDHVGGGNPPELEFIAVEDGKSGEFVSVQILGASAHNEPLVISVSGYSIIVNLSSSPTGDPLGVYNNTTNTQLATAINNHPEAKLLVTANALSPMETSYTSPQAQGFLSGAGPMEISSTASFSASTMLSASLIIALNAAATYTAEAVVSPQRIVSIQASSSYGMSSVVSGQKTSHLQATSVMDYQAIGALGTIQSASGQATYSVAATANCTLSHNASAQASYSYAATANLKVLRAGLTICDVVKDILLTWGISKPCAAPSFAKENALNVLNQSLQVIWNQAKDRRYWTSKTLTLSVPESGELALTDSIQNVIGHARLSSGELLTPLANAGEKENFEDAYLEESSSRPYAYYVDRSNQDSTDPAKCVLLLVPSYAATVVIDVVLEAPRYTVLDLESCPLCPIPHKYVESLLFPVCRYLSMSSTLFTRPERKESIVNDYQQARMLLDVADPLPAMSSENHRYRKEERE